MADRSEQPARVDRSSAIKKLNCWIDDVLDRWEKSPVTEGEIEQANNAFDLIDRLSSRKPNRWRPRIVAIGVFLVTVLIVGGLSIFGPSSISVQIEGSAVALGFKVDELTSDYVPSLTSYANATGLTFLNFKEVTLETGAEHRSYNTANSPLALIANRKNPSSGPCPMASAVQDNGSIVLSPVLLSSGVYGEIALSPQRGQEANKLLLSFTGLNKSLEATARNARVCLPQMPPVELDNAVVVRAVPGRRKSTVVVDGPPNKQQPLISELPVAALVFELSEVVADDSGQISRRLLSSLNSAQVTILDTEVVYNLPRGADLSIEKAKGQLTVSMNDQEGVSFRFSGQADNVSSSLLPALQIPSFLTLLTSSKPLALIWGTILYIFSMALAIIAWWKEPEKEK